MKRQGKSPNRKPADNEGGTSRRANSKKFRYGCPCRDGCEPMPGFNPAKSKPATEPKVESQTGDSDDI
jgi:hypothetical protein